MTVKIRYAQESDKDQWLARWDKYNEFYKRTIPADVTEVQWKRFMDPKVELYLAVAVDESKPEGSNVVGFVTWLPHMFTGTIPDIVYLHDLWSDVDQRNRGTGRALIQFVYDESKKKGYASVYWHTQHFNHRAQLLYTKMANKTDFVQYSHDL